MDDKKRTPLPAKNPEEVNKSDKQQKQRKPKHIAADSVGSHLGLRISDFESEKPLNLRISTFDILKFNGFPSRLELRDELSRIGAQMRFALAGSSHLEPR